MSRMFTVICLCFSVLACQAPAPPPPQDLASGARVIREMMKPAKLRDAGFFESYPDPRPSDFVSFINSDLGVILWPPSEDSPLLGELELEQSRAIGETIIPAGIAYSENRPNPDGGRQIVYRADDESGEVVVEAYSDPGTAPVFVRRWKLPLQ